MLEMMYRSPGGADHFGLRRVGERKLRVTGEHHFLKGEFYYQPYKEIHRAQVRDERTTTLIVQGPVMQATTRVFTKANLLEHVERSVVKPPESDVRKDLVRLQGLLREHCHD